MHNLMHDLMWKAEGMVDNSAGVAAVNLIVGKEPLLIDRARLSVIQAVRRGAATESDPHGRAIPVSTIRGGDITPSEVIELLSPSLFGEDRIVVITDVADAGKEPAELIVDAVKDPAPGVTLILQHSGEGRQKKLVAQLRQLGAVQFDANSLRRGELPEFVRNEFRSHGVSPSRQVVETVLDAVGSDLRELATAISQLAADTAGDVTPEAVRTYYGNTAEVSGFDIAELALSGNAAQALAKTRRALQVGVPPVLLASAVTTTVGDVAKLHAARGVNARRDAATYGMPPWKLEKTLRVARRWSTDCIARAEVIAARLEHAVKGGSRSPEYVIEKSVLEIARLAHRSHRAGV